MPLLCLRLNEFFKLRISTNLLISQFLEMADDASQGSLLVADQLSQEVQHGATAGHEHHLTPCIS